MKDKDIKFGMKVKVIVKSSFYYEAEGIVVDKSTEYYTVQLEHDTKISCFAHELSQLPTRQFSRGPRE